MESTRIWKKKKQKQIFISAQMMGQGPLNPSPQLYKAPSAFMQFSPASSSLTWSLELNANPSSRRLSFPRRRQGSVHFPLFSRLFSRSFLSHFFHPPLPFGRRILRSLNEFWFCVRVRFLSVLFRVFFIFFVVRADLYGEIYSESLDLCRGFEF